MFTERLYLIKAVAKPQNLSRFRMSAIQSMDRYYSAKKQHQQQQQQSQEQKQNQQQQRRSQPQQTKPQAQQAQQQEHLSEYQRFQQQQQQRHQLKSQANKAVSMDFSRLTHELTCVKKEHHALLDKYKRAMADSENICNRLRKQIEDAKLFGIQNFCKDLIEVADVLSRATQAVSEDQLDTNPDLKNLYKGLNLTRASLLQVFKRHGLEVIDPINEKFDPNMHEAVSQIEDKTVETNTVIQVTKVGYKLHKRCICPALVGVSKR